MVLDSIQLQEATESVLNATTGNIVRELAALPQHALLVAQVVVVLVVTYLIARKISSIALKTLSTRIPSHIASGISKAVFYAIALIGLTVALGIAGIDLSGLVLAGTIGGIVVGFAAQNLLSNFFAGILNYFERPFNIGDYVEISGDIRGFIIDIRMLSTYIRGLDGEIIRIPNNTIFTSSLINRTKLKTRAVVLNVGISYDDDPNKALEIIKSILDRHPLVLAEPPPILVVSELGDSSVNILVKAWVVPQTYLDVRKDLVAMIKKELERNGITIPFPQRVLHFATPLGLEDGTIRDKP